MKYLSKTPTYISPIPTQGSFSDAWVETGTRTISSEEDKELFTVEFHLKYNRDGTIIKIVSSSESFGEKQPTLILNENNEPEDIKEFLLRGGTYDKSKIVEWGRPSFYGIQEFFDITTILGDIQLTNQEPQRTIAKDWIDENVRIQAVLISVNFELEIL